MNCCDASGRCTNGPDCAARCTAPLRFAPGAIEHHRAPRQTWRAWLMRAAVFTTCAFALASAGGYVGGLVYALTQR